MPAGRPPTRPSLDEPEVVEALCARLSAGEGLSQICAGDDMPHRSAVYLRMATDESFRTAIARAREAQQHAVIDETVDLADRATPDNWQVIKLQIWARQWRAAKLAPKQYGDKVQHTGDGGEGPIQLNVRIIDEGLDPAGPPAASPAGHD